MEYLVDSNQMKAIDDYTINQAGIPSMVLMERAALAVSNKMLEKISKTDSILVICGTGNNGADGVAVARILKSKGFLVDIQIVGDENRSSEEFKQQLFIAKNLDVNVINNAKISEYNVIIDALFGIGLSKPITGAFADVIEEVNACDNLVFSVDIPSGIHSGCGQIMKHAVKADYTITFGYRKAGLMLYPGCEFAGEVTVEDVGFPHKATEVTLLDTFMFTKEDLCKLPTRSGDSNKGTFGKVLVIAGSPNMSGACYFSAKAAYRTGAGLVKVLTVEENRSIMQSALPEAIVCTYHPNTLKNKLEIDRVVHEIQWATVVVFGPGIGTTSTSELILDLVLKYASMPVILDADGLTMLAGRREYVSDKEEGLREINLPENVIITPHLKEMSRLLNCTTAQVKENLVPIVKNVTKDKQFVLVLKDARTFVGKDGAYYVNVSGNNGMATGGSGDVLTGVIAGLVANGMSTYDAACYGVYVHGLAGDMAAKEKSTYSLIASDIIDGLCRILP